MMFWLMVRDPAWNMATKFTLVAAFLGFAMKFTAGGFPNRAAFIGPVIPILIWNLLLVVESQAAATKRCASLALNLPIRARVAWAARAGAMMLIAFGFSAILVAVAYASHRGAPRGDLAALCLLIVACQILALAIGYAPCPETWELGGSEGRGWFVKVLGHVSGIAMVLLLAGRGWGWIALPLTVAALLLIRTYGAIPESFVVAPLAPPPALAGKPRLLPSPNGFHAPRILLGLPGGIMLILLAISALLPFPVFPSPTALLLVAFLAPVTLTIAMMRHAQIAHLPISRNMVFAWGVLPSLVVVLAGLALNVLVWGVRPAPGGMPVGAIGMIAAIAWGSVGAVQFPAILPSFSGRHGKLARMAAAMAVVVLAVFLFVLIFLATEASEALADFPWLEPLIPVTQLLSVIAPSSGFSGSLLIAAVLAAVYFLGMRCFQRGDVLFDMKDASKGA